ncbi:hypothetical protein [Brevibacillus laterosporus]|uniref:Acb2/Tad1 hairpin domain-containing protein n=1 Tax=Brevibacillus laterosporus TaxID=1465 RepID=A0AAP3DK76_BRELA|nr:hypothetical protein [Brevibacillus laterosporus]MCR8982655.1 hypothetical protein [Brevibacillus laterosporus]MCZ0809811.1 hypothetical protein [Brevibacillus laterosporus]MCZ0828355.1 hypothetical protein [Brevibacillus laterosporus]MCZ0852365.1 hypothetical protein [Brevibacillus laterosporus]
MNQQIENAFKYHSPKTWQPKEYTALREKAKQLAYLIDELCPNSREKSLAMTNLEQSIMWANASIARNDVCTSKRNTVTVSPTFNITTAQCVDAVSTQTLDRINDEITKSFEVYGRKFKVD